MRSAILAGAALALAIVALAGGVQAQSYRDPEGLAGRTRERAAEPVEGFLGRSRSDNAVLQDPEALGEDPELRERIEPRRPRIVVRAAPAGRCTMSRPLRQLSSQAALTLAWCLMEADRPLQAAPVFAHALEIGDARTRQEAAYGRTLAFLRKSVTDQAAISATDAPQSRQRNAEVGAVILEQRALAAFRDGRYVEAVFHLEDRERLAPLQNDLLVLKAYSYLRAGRSEDAARIFRAVERAGYPEGSAGRAAVEAALGIVRGE